MYVNDIILTGNNFSACTSFKQFLDQRFGTKDLRKLKYFLGIEVAHGSNGLFISQCKYALDIVKECGLIGANQLIFLCNKIISWAGSKENFHDPSLYRRLIGRLIYLTVHAMQ